MMIKDMKNLNLMKIIDSEIDAEMFDESKILNALKLEKQLRVVQFKFKKSIP